MSNLILFGAAELLLDLYSGLIRDQYRLYHNNSIISSPTEILLTDSCETNLSLFIQSHDLPGIKTVSLDNLKSYPSSNYIILSSSLKYQSDRANMRRTMQEYGHNEISIVSRNANIYSSIPNGCFISDGAYVGPLSRMSPGTIVLFNSVISRYASVSQDAFISANVTITAKKSIGSFSYIGAGVTIDANVGKLCVVGSGSVLKKDLDDYSLYDSATSSPPRIAKLPNESKALLARRSL